MHRIALTSLIAAVSASLAGAQAGSSQRPNIVLIITDDVGYGDFGSYGAPDVKTPNVDGLARDGVRLTDFYANGATCTPTRAGLKMPDMARASRTAEAPQTPATRRVPRGDS